MAKRVFKTKKKLSGVKTEYRAWKDWSEGDVLIGKLVGTTPNRKAKGKNDWIIEVEETFFADKKEMKRLNGKTVTLNCAGQFDKGMDQLEMQDLFQVTYNGQKEMQGGDYEGQMAHTMEVESVVEGDDSDEDEESDDEEDEESEDEEDDL